METNHTLRLRLAIPADTFVAHYRNSVQRVHARTLDGIEVEFPADALRRHVTHNGVYGLFEMHIDANHKLVRLDRIGD